MTRAIGYLRVSTSGQADHGQGLEAQRRRVREYAEQEGLELLEVVQETASGAVQEGELSSIEHRPVLDDLLERGRRDEYDVLLVASFDRLSRDQVDAQLLKRWFAKYGVQCLSAAGESNGAEGPIAELIDRILGAIHDFDRKRLLERMRSGKAESRRQGRHVEGPVPYGYKRTKSGVLKLDAAEALDSPASNFTDPARVVARMFSLARKGESPATIARQLNAHVPSPTGKTWTRQAVTLILTNAVYAGELHGVTDAHPPIVTRRAWNAVQTALKARSRAKP